MKKDYLKIVFLSEVSLILSMIIIGHFATSFLLFVWGSIFGHLILYPILFKVFIFNHISIGTLNLADGHFVIDEGTDDLLKEDYIIVKVFFEDNDE